MNPRFVFITGANRGLGLETARQLHGRGWRVLAGARTVEKAREAAQKIGPNTGAVEIDLADESSIEAAAGQVTRECGGTLSALINNAAVYLDGSASALKTDPARVLLSFQTNTMGPFLLARSLAAALKKAKGRIINVSSGMGSLSEMSGGYAGYRISKAALNAVTRILAAELAPDVSVNSVCPGWVRTDMGGASAPRSIAQGIDGIVWLADEAPADQTGLFFRDRRVIDW